MKRTLSITLAVLTIGLLGSCSKINERLDNLEKKVSGIENEQIASINSQIDGIKTSITDLGTIRSDISSLKQSASDHSVDIFNLEEADRALKDRILNLEDYVDAVLPNYAEKEWVEATFSTLEQYEATCDTIAKIDARIGALDAKLSKDIKATADSLTKWVNKTFEGYYTAAEMDASLAQMKSDIDSAKAANKITDVKADSISAELTKTKTEVDTAKAAIRAEYKAAVKAAIEESEGKLTKELTDKITTVNTAVTNLTTRVMNLEKEVDKLTGRVEKLEGMIQSVTIIPAYSDGSVESTKDGVLYLDIIVTPAEAVAAITKDCLKVMVNEVKTKAVDVDTVAVTKFKADAAKGTITARADISSVLPAEGKALTIAVNVRNGISDYTTEFYPVTLSSESNVTVTDEENTTKVTIKADEDFPESSAGNIVVADGFKDSKPTTIDIEVGGRGTVIFDAKATSQIKANAGQAGATSVFFKVEDVTTTKPVENADVVLEVTMKTVDENGTEVFNKDNAGEGAEVTIEIPIPEEKDVAFVNSVTLVNDAGEPIQGGVVPGSEDFDKEKGILSFKVNHFSKYAVDYVTNDQFKAVTGVSIEPVSVTLQVGDNLKLVANIAPEDATNKKVTWSSSDTTKVKVDDTGKITAVAFGQATITVTTKDGGKTATCTVKVSETKTMADILGTNTGIPESEDMTPPAKAWVKKTDKECKAFVGVDEGEKVFIMYKKELVDPETQTYEITKLEMLKDDTFEKTDDNTYERVESVGTFTIKMTNGKFTSYIFKAVSGSPYEKLSGTYASPEVILPAGALKGGFSVSATKTVYFSKGNMYWDGDSFEFEANQYDSQSSWNTSHVSHFYWSKNASVAYANEYSESGTTDTDVFFTNEKQETAKAGFTVNGVAGKYRTLSDDEWIYLVRSRTMTNGGSRYEKTIPDGITIEGVLFKGVVLFPDDFTDQETWKTKYTTWEALNSAGLVFLPAAGYRRVSEFTTVDAVGKSIGDYWSSSPCTTVYAHDEYFSFEAFNVGYSDRNKGCCIRLVTEGD